MICTDVTLHPAWGKEHRHVSTDVGGMRGDTPQVGVYVVESHESGAKTRVGIYGSLGEVLAMLDEMRAAAVDAVRRHREKTAEDAAKDAA